MGWGRSNTVRKPVFVDTTWTPPAFEQAKVDWERLVTVDFETYYDNEYTLKKLSTSEYVRDKRFKAQMVGIKIGSKATKWYPANKIKSALAAIPWATHSFLGHHAQFDGLILWERYGISPLRIYDTLSMARALYSNDIGAGLDEVSLYTGGPGKIHDVLETTVGVRDWSPALYAKVGPYCCRDVDETLRIFKHMLPHFPVEEIVMIDRICRMFTEPVLHVDRPRVQKELEREIEEKRKIMLSFAPQAKDIKLSSEQKKKLPPNPTPEDISVAQVKALIGSDKFADLLQGVGVTPPLKVSPAWVKADAAKRAEIEAKGKKWAYAFSKTDLPFVELQEHIDPRVRALVEARMSVKSTTNETRAGRFLAASEGGAALPVYLKYSAAHTHRLGGGNRMNMQNLKRGGELRKSILAPKGHVLVVVDSGQIEARVNAWLWGQEDLLDDFRAADRKEDRDAYCKFADLIYSRTITKEKDEIERFVGKTCLAADTLVLTNRGYVPIIEVRSTDTLWDGVEWVAHAGLLYQGIKPVQRRFGLAATPDHEVLTGDGWREWSAVHTDPSRMQSALCSANSRSFDGSTTQPRKASYGGIGLFASAAVALKRWSMSITFGMDARRVAIPVQRLPRARNGTGSTVRRWLMTNIVRDFSTDSLLRSLDARTRATVPTYTTAAAAYACVTNGSTIAPPFFGTCRLSPAGMTRASTWTANARTAIMNLAIFVSSLARKTLRTSGDSPISKNALENSNETTPVFDLANAGPRNRFTVLTDLGPVIVHNCILGLGYQMGAERLRRTLALGTQGPQVFISEEQARDIVYKYRKKNYRIKNGWDICQRIIEQMAAGTAGSYKCISWDKETLYLPNGMKMHYPQLHDKRFSEAARIQRVTAEFTGEDLDFDPDWPQYVYDSKENEKKIYGGLMCENIVQALARIIVLGQCQKIADKHRWVMSTHDEGVFLTKKAQGEKVYRFALSEFSRPPMWAPDLPLNADGGFDTFYSK